MQRKKNFQNSSRNKQQGFTLIEIMVVVIIIGVLAAMIGPNLMSQGDEARVKATKGQMSQIGTALDLYKLDNFRYPTTDQGLEALVSKPAGSPEPKNYKKDGYMKGVPKDAWQNNFVYISPGSHGPYDLISLGADGQDGGEDYDKDIVNWTKE